MDENLTTAGEPQVIESANTVDTNTAGLSQVQDANINDGSQVIESATPMDNNITYNNIPDSKPTFDLNKDYTQNVVQNALHLNYENAVSNNDGNSMTNFLEKDYDYDRNEAGTYWVAGAINDVDTQMSFLNTLIREEMYDEMDLQKYYYDTTLATARAYAAQKEKETAYGFYRAAQEKAIAEAQLTGWYMPAEGNYMLGQYTVAQNKLEDPDTSDEEKAKAARISSTVEKWFAANQISTRGIKCLNMMNYEENVRHNTIMGELQKEANKIAASQAAASASAASAQLRLTKFQLEEMELALGYDLTSEIGLDKDNLIGHNTARDYKGFSNLQGYFGTKDKTALANLLESSNAYYSSVLNATSKDYVDNVLRANGIDPKDHYVTYRNDQTAATVNAYLNSEAGKGATYISADSGAFEKTGKTLNGHEIQTTVAGNKVIAGYFEDGVFIPLTESDQNKVFSDGKTTVKDYLNNAFGENNIDWSGTNAITIGDKTYSFGRPETTSEITSYQNLTDNLGWEKTFLDNADYNTKYSHKSQEKVDNAIKQSQTVDGYKDSDGNKVRNLRLMPELMEEKNWNQYMILQGEDNNGNKTYYAVTAKGELQKKDASNIKEVGYVKDNLKVGDKIEFNGDAFNGDNARERIGKASFTVHYNKEGDASIMALVRSDGTAEYYLVKGDTRMSTGDHEILNASLTDEQVKKLGGTPLTNKQESKAVSLNSNVSSDEVKKNEELLKAQISSSGSNSGSSSPVKSGIDIQDTVNNQQTDFKETNPDLLYWENNSPLNTSTEKDEDNRNNINKISKEVK